MVSGLLNVLEIKKADDMILTGRTLLVLYLNLFIL